MRLNTKLLITYALIGALLLAGARYYTGVAVRRDRFQSISANFVSQLYQVEFALASFLRNVEYDVLDLANNEAVRTRDDGAFTNFLNADEATFEYHIGESEQAIIDLFSSYRANHPYANSVYMGRENGSFVRSHNRARPTQYDPRQRPWYELAVANPDRVMRTTPYPSVTTSDINIGMVKALVDEAGHVFGVVGIDITLRNLTDYMSRVSVGQGSTIVLLDDQGIVLTGPDQGTILTSTDHHASPTGDDQGLRLRSYQEAGLGHFQTVMDNSEGYTAFEQGGERYYAFYYTSPALGWKIVATMPVRAIDDQVSQYTRSVLLMLTLALLLFSALTVIGVRYLIVRPITRLQQSAETILRTGDLNHSVAVTGRDETGQLAAAFNEMMSSIARVHDELEMRVAERTADLEARNAELDAFAHTVAHDLKSPTSVILGYAEMLMQGHTDIPDGIQEKSLRTLAEYARKSSAIVDELLLLASTRQEEIEIYSLDMASIVAGAKERLLYMIEELGGEIVLPADWPVALGHGPWIEEVWVNYVNNALKYGGRPPRVELGYTAQPGSPTICFWVRDNGPGLSADEQVRVFTPFERLHQVRAEGHGLGLPIARRIVQRLGGEVGVACDAGPGCTFYFTLPASAV